MREGQAGRHRGREGRGIRGEAAVAARAHTPAHKPSSSLPPPLLLPLLPPSPYSLLQLLEQLDIEALQT